MVSGLPRETRCLPDIPDDERHFQTFAGVGPARAEAGARALIENGARALMSFGVAGGLSQAAPAGMVVLATSVADGDARHETTAAWRAEIRQRIGDTHPVVEAPLAGSDHMVPSPEAKRQLHSDTSAIACDMESHAVARVAGAYNVPFVVVRAISDPHDRVVPTWVLGCLTPDGGVRTGALIWQAARRPWSWGNVIGLAGDSGKAFDGLRRVALRLGPGLGLTEGL